MLTPAQSYNPSASNRQGPNGEIELDHLIMRPDDIAIVVPSQLASTKKQDLQDTRQDQENSDQKKEEKKENNTQKKKEKKKETPFQFWSRRIFIGKNKEEEEQEEKNHPLVNKIKKEIRRHMAEFVGSFFIVFFIAGIQVSSEFSNRSPVSNVDKGLVASFILTGLIYCFGKVSGAHFNPCVTLAFVLRGAFGFVRFISYVIVQFAGAVAGAAVLYGLSETQVISEQLHLQIICQNVMRLELRS